jgi:2-phospho-L-lactate/phosphoenolpyruvate guanylyltransferase
MNKNIYLWVIVPHRGVNAGKSRLSAVLNDVARGKLNRWLLARTVGVAAAWLGDAQRCVVVSPCEVTLALARKAGALALAEQASTAGLNAALSQAAAHAASLGAQRLLILPCDLPRLEVAALQAMQALAVAGNEAVIAPDRHHNGTNALLVDAGVREFAFGKDSYARHVALGDARGVRAVPCIDAVLAFDLDTEEDFAQWVKSDDVPQEFLATLSYTARPALRGAGFVSSRTK